MRKRPHKRSKPRKPQVSTIRETGRKGHAKVRKTPTEFRVGNVTREMLEKVPSDAKVLVNSKGSVKMVVYYRAPSK